MLLPLPLSPTRATISPRPMRQVDVVDGVQGLPRHELAHAEVARQPFGAEQRLGQEPLLHEDAAHEAPVDGVEGHGGGSAAWLGARAARREPAARGGFARFGGEPGMPGQPHPRAADRGERLEQPLRVRMERPVEQLARLGQLRDLARVHHEQTVGEVTDERHVVRHEDDREAELAPAAP